jgi:hypothetical protein
MRGESIYFYYYYYYYSYYYYYDYYYLLLINIIGFMFQIGVAVFGLIFFFFSRPEFALNSPRAHTRAHAHVFCFPVVQFVNTCSRLHQSTQ